MRLVLAFLGCFPRQRAFRRPSRFWLASFRCSWPSSRTVCRTRTGLPAWWNGSAISAAPVPRALLFVCFAASWRVVRVAAVAIVRAMENVRSTPKRAITSSDYFLTFATTWCSSSEATLAEPFLAVLIWMLMAKRMSDCVAANPSTCTSQIWKSCAEASYVARSWTRLWARACAFCFKAGAFFEKKKEKLSSSCCIAICLFTPR